MTENYSMYRSHYAIVKNIPSRFLICNHVSEPTCCKVARLYWLRCADRADGNFARIYRQLFPIIAKECKWKMSFSFRYFSISNMFVCLVLVFILLCSSCIVFSLFIKYLCSYVNVCHCPRYIELGSVNHREFVKPQWLWTSHLCRIYLR